MWRGVAWHGVVCGVAWYVAWRGVAWYVAWCCVAWHGVVCGVAWCGVVCIRRVSMVVCTALLAEAGVDSSDCVEKEELVQKVVVRRSIAASHITHSQHI